MASTLPNLGRCILSASSGNSPSILRRSGDFTGLPGVAVVRVISSPLSRTRSTRLPLTMAPGRMAGIGARVMVLPAWRAEKAESSSTALSAQRLWA
ncbi:hypothetical protein D3C80_1276740 [compost metagenome]